MNRLLIVLLTFGAVAACGDHGTGKVTMSSEDIARVAVYEDGRIELNGADASIDAVREAFAELAKHKGVVWYYRETADKEPHPNAMLVVQAIVEARLPVSMSTKPDFSDVVAPDGSMKPRGDQH